MGVSTGGGGGSAPVDAPYLTVGTVVGLASARNIQAILTGNEFYWPPPVPAGSALDLDAAALWWRKVGTPTGGVIYKTATAESISTLYGDDLLKCVAAANGDGLQTTWTYANECRVKSGTYMAVLCAVYLVTAAKTVTVSLVTSTPTTVATTTVTTTGSWQLVALQPSSTALDGTTVSLKATLDGAGTFYVVPLGALVSTTSGPLAMPLRQRGLVPRWRDSTSVKSLTGLGNEATWTDVSAQSATSTLAVIAMASAHMDPGATTRFQFHNRRKGSSESNADANLKIDCFNTTQDSQFPIILNDSQTFQYYLWRVSGSGTVAVGAECVHGWYEWA